jgi:hypothetical protein
VTEPNVTYTSRSSLPGHQSGRGSITLGGVVRRRRTIGPGAAAASTGSGICVRYGAAVSRSPDGSAGSPSAHAGRIDGRCGQLDGELLDGRQPEPDARERDPKQIGSNGRRELPALADHDVGLPGLDDPQQTGQRSACVDAPEELADHQRVGPVEVQLGERAHQRHPLLPGRIAHGRERQSRLLPLRRDQHLVAGLDAGVRKGCKREHMAGTATRSQENSH